MKPRNLILSFVLMLPVCAHAQEDELREIVAAKAAKARERILSEYRLIPDDDRSDILRAVHEATLCNYLSMNLSDAPEHLRKRLNGLLRIRRNELSKMWRNIQEPVLPVVVQHFIDRAKIGDVSEHSAHAGLMIYRSNEHTYHDVLMVLLDNCFSDSEVVREYVLDPILQIVYHDSGPSGWATSRSFVSYEDRLLTIQVMNRMISDGTFPERPDVLNYLSAPVVVLDAIEQLQGGRFLSIVPTEIAAQAEEAEMYLLGKEAQLRRGQKNRYESLVDELRSHTYRISNAAWELGEAGPLAIPTLLRMFYAPAFSPRLPEGRAMREDLSKLIIMCSDGKLQEFVVAILKRECFRSDVYISASAVRLLIGMVLHQHWLQEELFVHFHRPLMSFYTMPDEEYQDIRGFFEDTLRLLADSDNSLAIVLRTEILIALEYWQEYGYELPDDLKHLADTIDEYLPKGILRGRRQNVKRD